MDRTRTRPPVQFPKQPLQPGCPNGCLSMVTTTNTCSPCRRVGHDAMRLHIPWSKLHSDPKQATLMPINNNNNQSTLMPINNTYNQTTLMPINNTYNQTAVMPINNTYKQTTVMRNYKHERAKLSCRLTTSPLHNNRTN
eukprot:905386-Amorphochlora_amoeboformis.AAC.1